MALDCGGFDPGRVATAGLMAQACAIDDGHWWRGVTMFSMKAIVSVRVPLPVKGI